MRNKIIYLLIILFTSLTSCASPRYIKKKGMARIRHYEFHHKDLPKVFDGTSVVFISDLHYKSKFREEELSKTIRTIKEIAPDIIILGGDYVEGCENTDSLFNALGSLRPPMGIYAVMGNNDYEECHKKIVSAMKRNGIRLLEHENACIGKEGEEIIISGVRNPFDKANLISPTSQLQDSDFVIMAVHTPDYTMDSDITNTDLVLAGHTHGGQVTFVGLYAPRIPSKYGQRFRSGLKYNNDSIPVIITNGLGTSQKNIRIFAPSEIVWIILKSDK